MVLKPHTYEAILTDFIGPATYGGSVSFGPISITTITSPTSTLTINSQLDVTSTTTPQLTLTGASGDTSFAVSSGDLTVTPSGGTTTIAGDVLTELGSMTITDTVGPQFIIEHHTGFNAQYTVDNLGDLTLTLSDPAGDMTFNSIVDIASTTALQLTLSYDATNNTTFDVSVGGDLDITSSGTDIILNGITCVVPGLNVTMTRGSSVFDVRANLTVTATSIINQDVSTTATPDFDTVYATSFENASGVTTASTYNGISIVSPAANQFTLTRGAAILDMQGDLTCTSSCTIDQDLSSSSNVTFANIIATNSIESLTGELLGKPITGDTWYQIYQLSAASNDCCEVDVYTKDIDTEDVCIRTVCFGARGGSSDITYQHSIHMGLPTNQPRILAEETTVTAESVEINVNTGSNEHTNHSYQSFTAVSGYALSKIRIYLDSVQIGETIRVILRDGEGASGTILYTFPDLTFTAVIDGYYSFIPLVPVALTASNKYTIDIQEIVGNGFLRVSAIASNVYAGGFWSYDGVTDNGRDMRFIIYTLASTTPTWNVFIQGQPDATSFSRVNIPLSVSAPTWTDRGTGVLPNNSTGYTRFDTADTVNFPPNNIQRCGTMYVTTSIDTPSITSAANLSLVPTTGDMNITTAGSADLQFIDTTSPLLIDSDFGLLTSQCNDGTADGDGCVIKFQSSEAWVAGTPSSHGSRIILQTIKNTTTTLLDSIVIDHDGQFKISSSAMGDFMLEHSPGNNCLFVISGAGNASIVPSGGTKITLNGIELTTGGGTQLTLTRGASIFDIQQPFNITGNSVINQDVSTTGSPTFVGMVVAQFQNASGVSTAVTANGIDVASPSANRITLTRGTTVFDIESSLTLANTADCTLDQNLSKTSDVTFYKLTLISGVSPTYISTNVGLDDGGGASDSTISTERAIKTYADDTCGYDTTIHTTTVSGIWGATTPALSITCHVLLGVCYLDIPPQTDTVTAAAAIVLDDVLPTAYRPSTDLLFMVPIVDNANYAYGSVRILTTGAMTWYAGPNNDNFTIGNTGGINDTSVAYKV